MVLTAIRAFLQSVTRALGYFGMILILPMMLLTSSDAIGRDIFSKPIPGAFEISSYILSMFILCGIAYAQQMKDHVRVTILLDRVPYRLSVLLDMLTTTLSMLIIGVMAYQGWVLAVETVSVSDMLRIPQWPFRFLVFVGGMLLFMELFLDLTDYARKLLK